jgi:hypothetical protein
MNGVTPAMLEGFAAAKYWWKACAAGPSAYLAGLRGRAGYGQLQPGGISVSYSASNHHPGLDFADISIINATFLR